MLGFKMTFYALTPQNLAELMAHPKRLPAFERTHEKDQKRRSAMSAAAYEKYLARTQHENQDYAKRANNPWIAYEPRKKGYKSLFQLDLDQSWHGIHFLLTGTNVKKAWFSHLPFMSEPALKSPIVGGTKIGNGGLNKENRSFTARQVRQLFAELSSRSIEEWGKNYDPKKMHNLDIPGPWQREKQKAYDDFLLPNLQGLVTFFEEAAGQNLAVFKVMR